MLLQCCPDCSLSDATTVLYMFSRLVPSIWLVTSCWVNAFDATPVTADLLTALLVKLFTDALPRPLKAACWAVSQRVDG